MRKKVAIGISGGVDSAVSAVLLKQAGFEVMGVYLHCFPKNYQRTLDCTDKEDYKMAQLVAQALQIPFTFYDFEKEYQKKVIDYFFEEYRVGRTPNPDAVCNKEIKFGLFLEKAQKDLVVDFVATGHYARIKNGGTFHLLQGVDQGKDQSYFLYNLSQKQLRKSLFPIGQYTKKAVRQMAKNFGLPNWNRKDSQGICFLGKVSVRRFLEQRIKPKKGQVLDLKGNIIGEHDGVWFYTIGQRHGFKISSKLNPPTLLPSTMLRTDKARGERVKIIEPLYVVGKDVKNNRLIVGWGKDCERKDFEIESVNWINPPTTSSLNCQVRIRHLGQLYHCLIKIEVAKVKITLVEPAWGIAPGQVAVFYQKGEVLGGGIIS